MNIINRKIRAEIRVPGDKSISHRALMISSISKGRTLIHNFLFSYDSLSTLNCLRNLGIDIYIEGDYVRVNGQGLHSYKRYDGVLDAGNSGTTMRLLCGILSGMEFDSVIDGDSSLKKRPMDRIIKPLTQMGAKIYGDKENNFAPLYIRGGNINAISYNMEVNSAQVKSSILFAGLYANGCTEVYERVRTRDHTERMLKYFGSNIIIDGGKISISKGELYGRDILIPGDLSSASFFMVLAACIDGSELVIKNVGFNETRTGIIDVLREMGVTIEIFNLHNDYLEDVCDIKIYGTSFLRPINIEGDIIPRLIDEIPIICVLAAFAEGESTIRNVEELKYKESNRVLSIVEEFRKLNIDICEIEDGIKIIGGNNINGCVVDSHNDHRIAMAISILSCISGENIEIRNRNCINISFPEFYDILESILK